MTGIKPYQDAWINDAHLCASYRIIVAGFVMFTLRNLKCADSITVITDLEGDLNGEILGSGFIWKWVAN
jgi:hypothetical protein